MNNIETRESEMSCNSFLSPMRMVIVVMFLIVATSAHALPITLTPGTVNDSLLSGTQRCFSEIESRSCLKPDGMRRRL